MKPCPFCNEVPKMQEYTVSAEGGDFQYVFAIVCENSHCFVKPAVRTRGQRGYSQPEDYSNEFAERNTLKKWNNRIPNN